MNPGELKALRRELKCTAKELGRSLGLEQSMVLAWERGELFPTKAVIAEMELLRKQGPSAIARVSKAKDDPLRVLADEEFQLLLRKLLAHKPLRDAASSLAQAYSDPFDTEGGS